MGMMRNNKKQAIMATNSYVGKPYQRGLELEMELGGYTASNEKMVRKKICMEYTIIREVRVSKERKMKIKNIILLKK